MYCTIPLFTTNINGCSQNISQTHRNSHVHLVTGNSRRLTCKQKQSKYITNNLRFIAISRKIKFSRAIGRGNVEFKNQRFRDLLGVHLQGRCGECMSLIFTPVYPIGASQSRETVKCHESRGGTRNHEWLCWLGPEAINKTRPDASSYWCIVFSLIQHWHGWQPEKILAYFFAVKASTLTLPNLVYFPEHEQYE
jgi:hypothetical protein